MQLTDKPLILSGKLRYTIFKEGQQVHQSPWMPNNIVSNQDNGVNVLASNFTGATALSFEATSAGIGTGNTAPDDADTGLETPVMTATPEELRVARANQFLDDINKATVSFFFTNNQLTNGTEYKEFAIFIGGDPENEENPTARLWSRLLINPTYTHNGGDVRFDYSLKIQS